MKITHISKKLAGAAIGAVAAPTLLFLGAGSAQAIQDVNEVSPGLIVGAFNPQPDTPGVDDPGIRPSIEDPGIKVGIVDPGLKVGIGGPDTRPAR